MGLFKVLDGCQKIQDYGKGKDNEGSHLSDIIGVFSQVKTDYKDVEKKLRYYYGDLDQEDA